MHHVEKNSPVDYWKTLDLLLRQQVPSLYSSKGENDSIPSITETALVLSEKEFFSAAVILNNLNLIPEDVQLFCSGTYFVKTWMTQSPFIVGKPGCKTCGNHRLETLSKNHTFLGWNNPRTVFEAVDISVYGSHQLDEFQRALMVFRKVSGASYLEICDFKIEGKILKTSTKFMASDTEYKFHWQKLQELDAQLISCRNDSYWCMWCYQTFLGLVSLMLSKDVFLENPDHIPRAMKELSFAFRFLTVPLKCITTEVSEFFGNPKTTALSSYAAFVKQLSKGANFENTLHKYDKMLVDRCSINHKLVK